MSKDLCRSKEKLWLKGWDRVTKLKHKPLKANWISVLLAILRLATCRTWHKWTWLVSSLSTPTTMSQSVTEACSTSAGRQARWIPELPCLSSISHRSKSTKHSLLLMLTTADTTWTWNRAKTLTTNINRTDHQRLSSSPRLWASVEQTPPSSL